MNELRDFMADQAKKRADTLYGVITNRNSNGTYQVNRASDQVTVTATKANPSDEFLSGTWVVMNFLGGSGLAVGGGYVIVSRAPAEQKGLAGGVPDLQDEIHTGIVVLEMVPNPVQLRLGGSAVGAIVHGAGFLEPPLPYDDGITDDSAVIVSPTSLTLSLVAALPAVVGFHPLKLDSLNTIPDAIEVLPALGLSVPSIWAGYSPTQRISLDDGSVLDTVNAVDGPLQVLVPGNSYLYAVATATSGLWRIDHAGNATFIGTLSFPPDAANSPRGSVDATDTFLWMANGIGGSGISKIDLATGTVVDVIDFGTIYYSTVLIGTAIWTASDGGKIIQIDTATSLFNSWSGLSIGAKAIVTTDGVSLFFINVTIQTLFRFNMSSFVTGESADLGFQGLGIVYANDGLLYAIDAANIYQLDPVTLTVIQSLSGIGTTVWSMAIDSDTGFIWVVANDQVTAFDPVTFPAIAISAVASGLILPMAIF